MSWFDEFREAGKIREIDPSPKEGSKQKQEVDEEIEVNISEYKGDGSNYTNWTVIAYAWINDDGEKKHKHRMRVGFEKDTGVTKKQVKEKIEKHYKDYLKEETEKYSKQNLESEKQVFEELVEEAP